MGGTIVCTVIAVCHAMPPCHAHGHVVITLKKKAIYVKDEKHTTEVITIYIHEVSISITTERMCDILRIVCSLSGLYYSCSLLPSIAD